MKKNRILLIGNSNIANKRYINTFNKNKVQFSVASKSLKKKIKNAYKQYTDYEKAISTSDANIAFISLPNSLHYFWAKRALLNGYHVIVDKPITVKIKDTIELIRLAKQKNKLLSEAVFYNPKTATKEIVDEVFETVNDRNKLVRTLALAKSAIRHNMANELPKMNTPTAIIWGKQDSVTPPNVAEEFNTLLPDSNLYWIDKCGHAPMMEHPERFNEIMHAWMEKYNI